MKLIVFLSGVLVFSAMAESPPAIVKSADLQVDFAVLRRAYEELHPGLYRYSDKAAMDEKFEALRQRLSRDQSLPDAYLAFSVFAAQVKCGHTYPNFFNQKKAIAAALFQGTDRVPFYFRWLGGKMIVIQDFTPDRRLPIGSEVLSINGTAARAILDRLMTIARADGSNDAKRVAYLAVTGDSLYEAFDVYFPLFFPQKSTAVQLTALLSGEAGPRTMRVEALSFKQRTAPIQAREAGRTGGETVLFDWKYLDNGAAYLRMPTWSLYDSKWDWKAWLNVRLDELAAKNSPALIVDLRGNERS